MASLSSYSGNLSSERLVVCIDFGRTYVKVGYAGEGAPRKIFKSSIIEYLYKGIETMDPTVVGGYTASEEQGENRPYSTWCNALGSLFRRIFFEILHCKPKEVGVIICEQADTSPIIFRRACAHILFNMLEVRALRFADTAVAALYTTGSATGMVVDIGACETRVSTIVEGVQIGNARFNVHGLGAENVLDELSREMEEEGAMQANRDDLEEMLVQTCFVPPREDPSGPAPGRAKDITDYLTVHGNRVTVPGKVRSSVIANVFFPDTDTVEGSDIAGAILGSIRNCPIDARKAAVRNVVLMGGLAASPGFGYRLVQELKRFLQKPPNSSTWYHLDKHRFHALVAESMHIVDIGIPTMNTAWTGCAILGASKGIEKQMVFVQDSNSILKSSIAEKKAVAGDKKKTRRASLLSDAAGKKFFDANSLTSDTISDAYKSWEQKLVAIETTIEEMTTSPEQTKANVGGMHAIFAATKWKRSIKQAKKGTM
jgi:hypothetical protein